MSDHKQRIMEFRNAILATQSKLDAAQRLLDASRLVADLSASVAPHVSNELIFDALVHLEGAVFELTKRLHRQGFALCVTVRGSGDKGSGGET